MLKNLGTKDAYKIRQSFNDLLGKPKYKTLSLKKIRIYELCYSDCNEEYYDHSRKATGTRYGEHLVHIKYCKGEMSNVAYLVLNSLDESSLKLVRNMLHCRFFDANESLEITKVDILKNDERSPFPFSRLNSLLK